jgi:hypothetical protein
LPSPNETNATLAYPDTDQIKEIIAQVDDASLDVSYAAQLLKKIVRRDAQGAIIDVE